MLNGDHVTEDVPAMAYDELFSSRNPNEFAIRYIRFVQCCMSIAMLLE
jgi:hypothetical protein